jgi:hypothetical protein
VTVTPTIIQPIAYFEFRGKALVLFLTLVALSCAKSPSLQEAGVPFSFSNKDRGFQEGLL